jgi:2-polyprenyl-3-methyl-5-hydroxy-6-metoxy-1,4-benzoquinol methylase
MPGVEEIRRYQCEASGLFFFEPEAACGTGALYEALGRFEWYYMSDKWEYRVALDRLPRPGRLVEVGCGRGAFLDIAAGRGWDAIGLEINPASLANPEPGTRILPQSIEDFARENPGAMDATCAFQVLEHLPNPRQFLQACVDATRVGGAILLGTPNIASYLRYQYTLLDMPPHHMSQWSAPAYRFLEKILPIRLRGVFNEPLAPYHVANYLDATGLHLRRAKDWRRVFYSGFGRSVFEGLLQRGLRRHFVGQSMLAVFERVR